MSALTKFRRAVFGLNAEERARESCKAVGIPYEDQKFWPAWYVFKQEDPLRPATIRGPRGAICPELYKSEVGDTVLVFSMDGTEHFYQVLGHSWAPGDDHIVSPREFHIRYHHSEPSHD